MPWSLDYQQQVAQAIVDKIGGPVHPCAVCGVLKWELVDGFGHVALSDDPQTVELAGRVIPLVHLTCQNCGNTVGLNAIALGLAPSLREIEERERAETIESAEATVAKAKEFLEAHPPEDQGLAQ